MSEEDSASFENPAKNQAEVGKELDPVDEEEEDEEEEDNPQGSDEDLEESNDEDETLESEEEEVDDEEEGPQNEVIPIDWTPPDCPKNPNYKIGLRQLSESIAGRLGGKMPVLVAQAQRRLDKRQSIEVWLPSSLQKKCAPASAFLQSLVSQCDKIFRETNKTSLDKRKGLLAR